MALALFTHVPGTGGTSSVGSRQGCHSRHFGNDAGDGGTDIIEKSCAISGCEAGTPSSKG